MKNITFTIYTSAKELPEDWDGIAQSNAFLQKPYLKVLEESAPINMRCFFIGFFQEKNLLGIALAQLIDTTKLNSFGIRDNFWRAQIRKIALKKLASHVLIFGNNMITGQNGYVLKEKLDPETASHLLSSCSQSMINYLKKQSTPVNIICFKDFYEDNAFGLKKNGFANFYEFNHQPNMIFEIPKNWLFFQDYISVLTKKYRDQYKRASKKYASIQCKELSFQEIVTHEERIYELYFYVAQHAPFNTFFLAKNHFSTFKKYCGDQFLLFGHFMDNRLIGFHSLLINGPILETYFLGYDEREQKEKMLYLNMLYTMTEYAVNHSFEKIIFGRTASEIKSSIGAIPVPMSVFVMHKKRWINKILSFAVSRVEPKTSWQQRHPFK